MKQLETKLLQALKDQGLRMTPQRAIIIGVIEELKGHITAEEIFQKVQQISPYISLATVYRTLELLRDINLLTQTDFGHGQAHFALKAHGSHHHLVCLQCNSIEEFDDNLFDSIRETLEASHGFQVQTEHMSLFGLCQGCREA